MFFQRPRLSFQAVRVDGDEWLRLFEPGRTVLRFSTPRSPFTASPLHRWLRRSTSNTAPSRRTGRCRSASTAPKASSGSLRTFVFRGCALVRSLEAACTVPLGCRGSSQRGAVERAGIPSEGGHKSIYHKPQALATITREIQCTFSPIRRRLWGRIRAPGARLRPGTTNIESPHAIALERSGGGWILKEIG